MTLDGLLLAEKGPGVTSFHVVAHVRRVLRVPKVGHGGTLDPMATGVLPILLGTATKLTPFIQAQDKEYVATIRLGVATDTLDATGRVTAERPVPPLDGEAIETALARFVGEIAQVPPMFSALHVGGRRLHELARAGVEVPRAPRRVRVDAIAVLTWKSPLLVVRVTCGKGTYIRSLAADLGEVLGCGASLDALERTRLGAFSLADSVPWSVLREADPAVLRARVLGPDRAVPHLPIVAVGAEAAWRLSCGQRVGLEVVGAPPAADEPPLCRLYAGDTFLGIGELVPSGLRAVRFLHANLPRP